MRIIFFKKHKKRIQLDQAGEGYIYAPVTGKVLPLEKVNDVVFSQKMLGDGFAIEPEEGTVYSPVKGKISVVFPTGHVIGIETADGANIIIHVGIDTVELNGEGFDVKVNPGDIVDPGDLLIKVDLSMIRKNHMATTMVVVENSEQYQITHLVQSEVKAGEELMKLERRQN